LINHLKCAAFELPIAPEDRFGEVDVQDLCARLAEAGYLHRNGRALSLDTASLSGGYRELEVGDLATTLSLLM